MKKIRISVKIDNQTDKERVENYFRRFLVENFQDRYFDLKIEEVEQKNILEAEDEKERT